MQASAGLFYDVLGQREPAKRLLAQADAEVLAQQLDLAQLGAFLARLRQWRVESVLLRAPSRLVLALTLTLMVERFREQLSTEQLADRLARIVADAETPRPPARRALHRPCRQRPADHAGGARRVECLSSAGCQGGSWSRLCAGACAGLCAVRRFIKWRQRLARPWPLGCR